MRVVLCNEVIRELDFASQCMFAQKLGYYGLEIAPFTLDENPHLIRANRRAELRRMATDAGISITGLHWLLVAPKGLSIVSPDNVLRRKTIDVILGLIDLCSDLGGKIIVHGSPMQRNILPDDSVELAWERAQDVFSAVVEAVRSAGIVYCIEPLAQTDTNFINSVEQAAKLVQSINSPAFQTMIDTSAARTESLSTPDLIDRWMPTGIIKHIHFNDPNRLGPGQGNTRFSMIAAALRRQNYSGLVGVEPFEYIPDGCASAARAMGYIQGVFEELMTEVPSSPHQITSAGRP